MKTYELNTYSTTRHNLIVFVGIAVAMSGFVLTMVEKQSFLVCMITFLGIMGFAKFLAYKLEKANANFSVSEKGFGVLWTKNFAFWREPKYDFRFEELQEYVFEPWGEVYRLKITTKEGKSIKFLFKKSKNDTASFTSFFDDLQNSIKTFNNKDNDTSNDVRVGKTFWESRTAKVFGIFLAIVIILGWTKLLTGEPTTTNMPKMVVATIAGVFYIGRIIFAAFPNNDKS